MTKGLSIIFFWIFALCFLMLMYISFSRWAVHWGCWCCNGCHEGSSRQQMVPTGRRSLGRMWGGVDSDRHATGWSSLVEVSCSSTRNQDFNWLPWLFWLAWVLGRFKYISHSNTTSNLNNILNGCLCKNLIVLRCEATSFIICWRMYFEMKRKRIVLIVGLLQYGFSE